MKICTIIGARPQFVKAAVVSRAIHKYNEQITNHKSPITTITEVIVHTGQHFDDNMSKIFFDEMDIPKPDYHLDVSSHNQSQITNHQSPVTIHGAMTGRMLEKIEEILLSEKPDMVLVYGDTNSTLAGAIAASKLHMPVAHVEAGLRSFNRKMPEEINRILTDHVSSYLFCPTDTAVKNLANEGITKGVHNTGDVMYDAYIYYSNKVYSSSERSESRSKNHNNGTVSYGEGECLSLNLPKSFMLITLHRAENTDDPERLRNIVDALGNVNIEGILPIHPRTKKALEIAGLKFKENITLIEPVGYLGMLNLENKCEFIVTDSGGVQKEAYFAKKPCITVRDETEWVETVEAGWNRCVGADAKKIAGAIKELTVPKKYPNLYGNGTAGEKILEIIGD